MMATPPVHVDFVLGLAMRLFPAFFASRLYLASFSSVIQVSVIVRATFGVFMLFLMSSDGFSASAFALKMIMCIGVVMM